MIKSILNFCLGYLIIEIRGNALERFISQVIGNGIQLWGLTRVEKKYYQAKINIKDFKKLRSLVRKRLCQVKIIKKCGLPFLLAKIRRRYFFLLGVIVFLVVFWMASSFLWFINIEGLDKIHQERIYNILTNIGITPGTYKGFINLETTEQTLLKEIPLITWIDLTWQGTRLNVEIVEKKVVEKTQVTRITAARDGVITELIVLKGRPVINEGDTVTRGQALIVPETAETDEEVRGIVKAHVWYEGYGEAAIVVREPVKTGKYKTIWGIKFNNKVFYLLQKPDFNSYILKRTVKSLPKWRNLNLPIKIISEKYEEVEYLSEKRERDVALFIAKERALDKILNEISSEAIILETKAEEISITDNNKVKVRILLKVEEDIASMDKISEEDLSGSGKFSNNQ